MAKRSKTEIGPRQPVARLLASIYRVEKWVAAVAFGVMTLLVLSDILLRELFGRSFAAGPKLGIFLMIWGGFLGASLTSAKGAHLRAEAALRLWPRWSRPAVETAGQAMTAAFCGFMSWISVGYVVTSRELGELAVVTDIPLWIVQAVIPYTFVSMTLRHSIYAVLPSVRPVMALEDLK